MRKLLDSFTNSKRPSPQLQSFPTHHSPGRISRQSGSHHVSIKTTSIVTCVTQRPNPFQHYSQCLGNFTSLASAPQRLACQCAPTALQMRLQHCPPSPSSPLLTLSHPHHYHPYACVVPSLHASNTASHPYAHVVPSQHASDNSYHPYARVVPSRHASDTTHDPYACVVPSRHASNTAYHPYARGVPS
ncbi:hypothetical protein O181_113552 [Austropuccinia psidii MF-1]|uniref:Uncharacterized protein n=1 Tax=Austropuccinia psidii MF-1 TaxID=1389203 RepID=A0A9Q3K3X1_9BASI|nr:hypothetical protein [Austropuccinia psidii MF-1]